MNVSYLASPPYELFDPGQSDITKSMHAHYVTVIPEGHRNPAASLYSATADKVSATLTRKVTDVAAEAFFRKVLTYPTSNSEQHMIGLNERGLKAVQGLYAGQGRGSEMASANGTAWGLVNSITEYVDHHRRARSDDHRLDAAWFGAGASIKQKAWDEALKLVA